MRAGIITAAVYNSAPGDGSRKAVSAWDFVPGGAPPEAEVDLRTMTPDEQATYLLNQFSKKHMRRR